MAEVRNGVAEDPEADSTALHDQSADRAEGSDDWARTGPEDVVAPAGYSCEVSGGDRGRQEPEDSSMSVGVRDNAFPIWPEGKMRPAAARLASATGPAASVPAATGPAASGPTATEQQTPMLWNSRIVRNVSVPTLTPYLPARPNGASMIVCPGGAFQFLMVDKEGSEIASWLNSFGLTVFVLHYRLAPTPRDDDEFVTAFQASSFDISTLGPDIECAKADGRQAVAAVRSRAREFNLDPAKIGIMGFSAGATVAVNTVLKPRIGSRPDFVAAIYGGYIERVRVPGAPPLFVAFANDDDLARDLALRLHRAWVMSKRPVDLHAYSAGGHGFGLNRQGLPADDWADAFVSWLRHQGLVAPQR